MGKSKTQINEVYHALKFIFESAVENRLINKSPATYIKRPEGTRKSRRSITDTEREYILNTIPNDSRFIIFATMLCCGCRPSEARNIQRNDFRKENNCWILHIRGTKTKSAARDVPVPTPLLELLTDYLAKPGFDYMVVSNAGNPFTEQNFRRLWNKFKRELNIAMGASIYRNQLTGILPLANDLVPYCLRHTYCTDLQKVGVDIRTAQYLMGHSDIKMTANIYTHVDKSLVLEAAKLINSNVVPSVVQTPKTVEN